jgi:hypothetical protein
MAVNGKWQEIAELGLIPTAGMLFPPTLLSFRSIGRQMQLLRAAGIGEGKGTASSIRPRICTRVWTNHRIGREPATE